MGLLLVCVSDSSLSLSGVQEAACIAQAVYGSLFHSPHRSYWPWNLMLFEVGGEPSPGITLCGARGGPISLLAFDMLPPPPCFQHISGTFCFSLQHQKQLSEKPRSGQTKGQAPLAILHPFSPSCKWRSRDLNSSHLLRFCLTLSNHWGFDRGVNRVETTVPFITQSRDRLWSARRHAKEPASSHALVSDSCHSTLSCKELT